MDIPCFVYLFISWWTHVHFHMKKTHKTDFSLTLGLHGVSHVDKMWTWGWWRATSSVCCSLMLACYAGHLDVVKYLRRHGASWEARDLGGCTALHWAADGGHCPVIEWMIKDGCEVWAFLVNHRVPSGTWNAFRRAKKEQGFGHFNLEMLRRASACQQESKDLGKWDPGGPDTLSGPRLSGWSCGEERNGAEFRAGPDASASFIPLSIQLFLSLFSLSVLCWASPTSQRLS
jgi:hypothetical protein